MRDRSARRLAAVILALVALSAACAPGSVPDPSVTDPSVTVEPRQCPYDEHTVQSNGDSVGFAYANRLRLDGPWTVFNAAQGASNWTISTQVPTIAARVREWIERCGNPAAVIIEGGIIDITRSMPLEDVYLVVSELSDWLEARGVPTVWVALNPFPSTSPYQAKEGRRSAYNEWLTTPGRVWGSTVDCTSVLEDPLQPATLRRDYWKVIDLFGNPDGVHPNTLGYEVMAGCVRPVVLDVLARESTP